MGLLVEETAKVAAGEAAGEALGEGAGVVNGVAVGSGVWVAWETAASLLVACGALRDALGACAVGVTVALGDAAGVVVGLGVVLFEVLWDVVALGTVALGAVALGAVVWAGVFVATGRGVFKPSAPWSVRAGVDVDVGLGVGRGLAFAVSFLFSTALVGVGGGVSRPLGWFVFDACVPAGEVVGPVASGTTPTGVGMRPNSRMSQSQKRLYSCTVPDIDSPRACMDTRGVMHNNSARHTKNTRTRQRWENTLL